MGQFSVHANCNPRTSKEIPFLLDVQSDLLSGLATRMVVPLYLEPEARSLCLARLTPVLPFLGRQVIAMVPEMAGIHRRDLGPAVGDLSGSRAEVLGAIDMLLTGF